MACLIVGGDSGVAVLYTSSNMLENEMNKYKLFLYMYVICYCPQIIKY